jgi:tetratricopeptide (TPR) repeat protein
MSWSKETVLRHIAAVEGRASSSDERKLQGYTLARICLKANLYHEAIRYLNQYLALKGDDFKAHKLLAEIYKLLDEPEKSLGAYKRSLEFKKNQLDVILEVGELYCALPDVTEEDLKHWISVTSNIAPTNPIILKLKAKMVTVSKSLQSTLPLATETVC